MVARPLGRVKWLALLGLAALLVQGDSAARRLPPPEEFTETGMVQRDAEEPGRDAPPDRRFVLDEASEASAREALLAGHRGLGTVADPILEGPAGVRVLLVGGDLVWHGSFLPHGVPRSRLGFTLTYDRRHAEGPLADAGPGLPPGWRHAYQRTLRTGAWGQYELWEDDGFVHRFYRVGEQTDVARDALIDTLVQRRNQGGLPPGDPVPFGPVLRRNLEEDPIYLEQIRARLLGAGTGLEGRYGSRSRGHAVLWVDDEGAALLRRHDGTLERFDAAGRLLEVVPPAGPALVVERDRDGVGTVSLDLGPRLQLERDGRGRLVRVDGAAAREVRMEYGEGQLERIESPAGAWHFGYGEDGRSLTSVQGPDDWVRIEYDERGRVASLEGPGGVTRVRYGGDAAAPTATVDGPTGRFEVELDAGARERVVRGPHGRSVVRFDGALQRPLEVDGTVLAWDDAGHVVAISGPDGVWTVERDGAGRPARIVTPAATVSVEVDDRGRLQSAQDQTGVRQSFEYDARGWLARETDGGREIAVRRGLWGEVERVTLAGGESYSIRRDAAGRPLGLKGPSGSELRLAWDAADRLSTVQAPGSQRVELDRSARHTSVRDHRGNTVQIERGLDGRLAAVRRAGPGSGLTIEADSEGLPARLDCDRGWSLRVTREAGQVTALQGAPGGPVRVVHDDRGVAGIEVAGARWDVTRDAAGQVERLVGSGGRDLRLRHEPGGALAELARGPRTGFRTERDAAGRPARFDPASGEAWTTSRDGAGRVEGLFLDDEVVLRLQRDSRGRVDGVFEGEAERGWRAEYGLAGWPDAVVAPDGRRWALRRDGRGVIEGYVDADGTEGTALWDAWGELVSLGPGWGDLSLRYDHAGSLAGSRSASRGAWSYVWKNTSVEVEGPGGGAVVAFDPHGRWRETASEANPQRDQRAELGPAGALLAWVRGEHHWTMTPDAHGRRARMERAGGGPVVEWRWGTDGLLSGVVLEQEPIWIERDALGRPLDGPARDAAPRGLPPELAPWLPRDLPRSPAAAALLGPALPETGAADRGAVPVSAPTPRWVEDRLRAQQDLGWAAALPRPPGDDLPVPGTPGSETVTVAGLLALLGFVPDDLADHRTLVAAPAPAVTVRCPAVAELRALHDRWSGDPGLGAIALDPALGGVVRMPRGAPVGHPTPWAAVDDPWALRDPAAELLGATGVPPAVAGLGRGGAADDGDPLAAPLRAALDHGRWLSARPTPSLAAGVGTRPEWAGAIALWTAARVQVVVDGDGVVRGLDVGSSAQAAWNRHAVAAWLAAAVEGRDGGALLTPPPWLPTTGAAPERSLGLRPGPGPLWPDLTGDARVAR